MIITFHAPRNIVCLLDPQVMCSKIFLAATRPFFLSTSIAHDMVVSITSTGLTSMFGIKVMLHSQIMTNFMSHNLPEIASEFIIKILVY